MGLIDVPNSYLASTCVIRLDISVFGLTILACTDVCAGVGSGSIDIETPLIRSLPRVACMAHLVK